MALINPKEVKVGEAANLCQSVSEFEQEIATHSSILAWGIPWTEEPWGLRVRQDLATEQQQVSEWGMHWVLISISFACDHWPQHAAFEQHRNSATHLWDCLWEENFPPLISFKKTRTNSCWKSKSSQTSLSDQTGFKDTCRIKRKTQVWENWGKQEG